jgi:hypothetical protein
MSNALDESALCTAAVRLISNTFNVLSVTIWLYDESKDCLVFAASTSKSEHDLREATFSSGLAATSRF